MQNLGKNTLKSENLLKQRAWGLTGPGVCTALKGNQRGWSVLGQKQAGYAGH